MKPSTMPLFEREIRDQIAAARAAVEEAGKRQDPLLLQAAEGHLDGLVALAQRNGVRLDDEVPAPATPADAGATPADTALTTPAG